MNKYFGLSQPVVPTQVVCGWCGNPSKNINGLKMHTAKRHKGQRVKVRRSSDAPQTQVIPPKQDSPKLKPDRKRIQKSVGVSHLIYRIFLFVRKRVANVVDDKLQHLF